MDEETSEKKALTEASGLPEAVILLRRWIQGTGKKQADIETEIGLPTSSISSYLRKSEQIPPRHLVIILPYFNPPLEEAEAFVLSVRKDKDRGTAPPSDPQWLRRKIEEKEWNVIAFPSLDPEWLAQQPPYLQAALLLRDLMEAHNKTWTYISAKLRVFDRTFKKCLEGKCVIMDDDILSDLMKALGLSEEEKAKFHEVVTSTRDAVAQNAKLPKSEAPLTLKRVTEIQKHPDPDFKTISDQAVGDYEKLLRAARKFKQDYDNLLDALNPADSSGYSPVVWQQNQIQLITENAQAIAKFLSDKRGILTPTISREFITSLDWKPMPAPVREAYLDLLHAAMQANPNIVDKDHIEPFAVIQAMAMDGQSSVQVKIKALSYKRK